MCLPHRTDVSGLPNENESDFGHTGTPPDRCIATLEIHQSAEYAEPSTGRAHRYHHRKISINDRVIFPVPFGEFDSSVW